MKLFSLETYNFRNLKKQEQIFDRNQIFLIGLNGQGKTNFLEAIYLLSYGTSFRTKTLQNIITHNEKELSIIGKFRQEENEAIDEEVKFKIANEKKEIRINSKLIKDKKELLKRNPSFVFSHEDLNIVTGPHEGRRTFFNQTISLVHIDYLDSLRKYNKLLKMRNKNLKENNTKNIDIYDYQLSIHGLEIHKKRLEILDSFNDLVCSLFCAITGLDLNLRIKHSASLKDCSSVQDVLAKYEKSYKNDLAFKTTTFGPHRDRYDFVVDNRNYIKEASTGQMRVISLILKTAQANFIYSKTGVKPILLFDDVFLEIDEFKRKNFFNNMPAYEQMFLTFLPDEKYMFFMKQEPLILKVESGRLLEA